jgi:hypothetical protein
MWIPLPTKKTTPGNRVVKVLATAKDAMKAITANIEK